MAVSTSLDLPAQPAIGSVVYRDLGGDGLRSPRQLVTARVQSNGDGTGGQNTIDIKMDPAYMAILNWAKVELSGGVPVLADGVFGFEMRLGPEAADNFGVRGNTFGASLTTSIGVVTPPPIPLVRDDQAADLPDVLFRTENLNGTNMTMVIQLFTYLIDAQFKTPIEQLVAGLPRGYAYSDS